MQPVHDPTDRTGHADPPADFFHMIASRRHAVETLRSAVLFGRPGPILITGAPGAGKTALALRFAAEDQARWRIASVDLAAEMNAIEFLRLIGHALGVRPTNRLGKARIRLQDALANQAADGRRLLLIVDQAHRGRSPVWDEVQAIANHLGRPRGFAALFIVGETDLARTLAWRRSSIALASQVRTHIHLGPLDLDDARDLLDSTDVADVTDQWMLEELHRQSRGNLASLLRLAHAQSQGNRALAASASNRSGQASERDPDVSPDPLPYEPNALRAEAQPDSSREVVKEQTGSTRRPQTGSGRGEVPALFPSKPPIRDEDGLVEVGWEGDLDAEPSAASNASNSHAALVADQSPFHEELIDDPYAALQAQAELSRNEAWLSNASASHPRELPNELPQTDGTPQEAATLPRDSVAGVSPGGVRAEGQHEFAPYSQLFTRYRQSK
jgi:general secretion pathway protein A